MVNSIEEEETKKSNEPSKVIRVRCANGKLYSGYIKNNKPEGEGELTTPGERVLVGTFKDGQLHGKG